MNNKKMQILSLKKAIKKNYIEFEKKENIFKVRNI